MRSTAPLATGSKRIYARPGNSGGPVKGGVEQSGGHSSPTLSGLADLGTLGGESDGVVDPTRETGTDPYPSAKGSPPDRGT